ncbi:MAG: 5-formyltetrahydrofolate cyclo-ligase [Provencibacterium sp.]|nr:5-formyltetrahydrofolate cyclo-ligase [Provencibacterium sp.]
MPVGDIRIFKNELRAAIKQRRRSLEPAGKERLDRLIRGNVLRLHQYQRAKTVILYMSTAIEVDTLGIIRHALAHGKRVALPRCLPGTRLMDFYYIRSLEDLEPGSYGLLEPKTDCEKLVRYENSICLVPALAYDRSGYRLGYGGGYYDRFLSGYTGTRIGLIYSADIRRQLPHGRFDRPVQLIVSDRGFFYIRKHPENAPGLVKGYRKGPRRPPNNKRL